MCCSWSTNRFIILFLLAILVTQLSVAVAQENPQPAAGTKASAKKKSIGDNPYRSSELSELHEKMDAMRKALDAQSAEIETLKKKNAEQENLSNTLRSELGNVQDEIELASMGDKEEFETERLLSVFGFFDLTFFKGFASKDSAYRIYVPEASTFTVTNANFYFKSQLTESLSALAELRFSFLPHGKETSFEMESVLPDGTVLVTPDEYSRVDTTVMDPITTMEFRQGGVTIERIHLTYSPFDWLNVIAGRYLTPYGIWNIDHGSPVVLPARIPMIQYRRFIPLAQTGLQIYGRFFPNDKLFIDYAVTLSNGRGPIEEVYDLDENKGIGLRLRLTFTGKMVNLVTGAYGYTGEGGDIKKRVVAHLNSEGEMDMSLDRPVRLKIIKTSAYREYALSYDFCLSIVNITLQAEAVINRVRYSKNTLLGTVDSGFNGGSVYEEWYMPSYTGYGGYVLIGYQLPLPLSWLRVTPYVVIETSVPMEFLRVGNTDSVTAGLNIKPSPYVSIKGEYMIVRSDVLEPFNAMTFQLAVSF